MRGDGGPHGSDLGQDPVSLRVGWGPGGGGFQVQVLVVPRPVQRLLPVCSCTMDNIRMVRWFPLQEWAIMCLLNFFSLNLPLLTRSIPLSFITTTSFEFFLLVLIT